MTSNVKEMEREIRERSVEGHAGHKAVSRLLRLHDNLEASRGVTHPEVLKVRDQQLVAYWTLRTEIAALIGAVRDGW